MLFEPLGKKAQSGLQNFKSNWNLGALFHLVRTKAEGCTKNLLSACVGGGFFNANLYRTQSKQKIVKAKNLFYQITKEIAAHKSSCLFTVYPLNLSLYEFELGPNLYPNFCVRTEWAPPCLILLVLLKRFWICKFLDVSTWFIHS